MKYIPLYTFKDGSAIVQIDTKQGLLSKEEVEIIPTIYDFVKINELEESENPHLIVELNKKQGLYTIAGELLVAAIYDEIIPIISKSEAIVKLANKYGVISLQGKVVISIQCESLYYDYCLEKYILNSKGEGLAGNDEDFEPDFNESIWGY